MRPQLPDEYHVDFDYYAAISKRPPKGETSCVETLVTRAHVYDHAGRTVARATAWLNPGDHFSLRTGRDIALGRAIAMLREKAAA